MSKFICTAPAKDAFNVYGEFIGVDEKRAIFYSKTIGTHRWYRAELEKPQKGLTLLVYSSEKRATEVCNEINKALNDNFQPEPYEEKV